MGTYDAGPCVWRRRGRGEGEGEDEGGMAGALAAGCGELVWAFGCGWGELGAARGGDAEWVAGTPTCPEPGLSAFSFPQGGVDTGGVTGAIPIGPGSESGSGLGSGLGLGGSYVGTDSGVAGAIIATDYTSFLGQSWDGECVALAQATSDVGYTGTWSPGVLVEGDTDIATGTVIATFGDDGTYTNAYGQSQTAIYLGQDSTGIYVEDQWLDQVAHTRVIPWTTANPYESGSQFYVLMHG